VRRPVAVTEGGAEESKFMQIPLQVTFHRVDASPEIEEYVQRKVEKLERFHDRITGCRVAIEAPHQHHAKGNAFHVRIELSGPGDKLVITRDPGARDAHDDIQIVLRDAFQVATRMLEARHRDPDRVSLKDELTVL
jgi:ribosome-associated translation inhibitor RaiA